MRQKAIMLASGFAISVLWAVALWQVLAVLLLVRATIDVLGALGRVL
jgi:hypothetical protein